MVNKVYLSSDVRTEDLDISLDAMDIHRILVEDR
jgi:hypothetical protein